MHLGSGTYAVLLFFLISLCRAQLDSFMNQGVMRTFIVHKPSGTSSPALVINMHGYGLTASQQQSFSRFDDIADREKFIVVYPNGIRRKQIKENSNTEFKPV